jgi:hypothetical protein
MCHLHTRPEENSVMAEHASKLDQIRALREARILAAERAASTLEKDKKPSVKASAVTDPAQGE